MRRVPWAGLKTWVLANSILAPRHRQLMFRIILLTLWAYFMGYVTGRSHHTLPRECNATPHLPTR